MLEYDILWLIEPSITRHSINQMGNSITIGNVVPGNWKQVTPHIYQNTETKELVELAQTMLPGGQSMTDYCCWYEARLSPLSKYVRVLGYKLKGSACCNSSKEMVVFTERIYRLSQLDLSPEELSYVLHEGLIAFRELFREFGLFRVTNRMIGVNEKGVAKVWINQNFAQNHLDDEEDRQPTEEETVISLITTLDKKSRDLQTAFRQYSKKITLDSLLAFALHRLSQQPFTVHEVFLERSDFEAFRARSTIGTRHSLDFSFAAKQDKLESSLQLKADHNKQSGIMQSPNKNVPKQNQKCVAMPPLPPQRSSVQLIYAQQLQVPMQTPSHLVASFSKLPHMHSQPNSNQSSTHKAYRSSVQQIPPQRHSAGVAMYRMSDPQPAIPHHVRRSSQLKPSPKNPPNMRINIVSPAPAKLVSKPQQGVSQTPSSTSINTSESIHRRTITSMNSLNPLNDYDSSIVGGHMQSQTHHGLDFTLNRQSGPNLTDSRRSGFAKKSDSQRLFEHQQAEMYRKIPTVDSVVVISRSDRNHEMIDIDHPPDNCHINLIESTIQRGLCNNP